MAAAALTRWASMDRERAELLGRDPAVLAPEVLVPLSVMGLGGAEGLAAAPSRLERLDESCSGWGGLDGLCARGPGPGPDSKPE